MFVEDRESAILGNCGFLLLLRVITGSRLGDKIWPTGGVERLELELSKRKFPATAAAAAASACLSWRDYCISILSPFAERISSREDSINGVRGNKVSGGVNNSYA